jgi:DNA-binding transcriptional MerR regulator
MYKIEQVSRMAGLSQKRIRDYEKEGLIKPARHANTNDRLFSQFDVKQIKRIKSLIHERGFTIPALKQLLTMARGWDVYQCREKENCDAFKNPHKRCWEIRRQGNRDYYREFCTVCPLYLARKTGKIQLLEKPHGGV